MTNQMKMILKTSLIACIVALITAIAALFVGGFGYLYLYSYLFLAVLVISFVVLLIMYINMKADERAFKRRIAYYKLLKDLRNKAVLDFYNKFGLKPQYSKEGRLLTPDELLGILTSLDNDGNLDPSIYERLGILPKFDKDGKEIPVILVLKHLIRTIKTQKLSDVKKLKGLYAKGTKVKKAEPKKEVKKPVSNKKSVKKDKGGKKKKDEVLIGRTVHQYSNVKLQSRKKKEKKAEKNPAKLENPKKTENEKPVSKPIITKIDKQDIQKSNDDYLKKMYSGDTQNNQNKQPKVIQQTTTQAEYGECTPE